MQSEKFKLWFFRDLSDEQRKALLSLHGMPGDGLNTHGAQDKALRILFPSPISADAVVEACSPDSKPIASWREQAAFEEWAKDSRYDMTQHPLHYLFVDKQTNAARQGWKAALAFIRALKGTFPAAPEAKSDVAGWVTPLEWNTAWGPDADGDICFTAGTPFGSFNVERLNGSWRWRYCFDEYYDEESFECEDEADGKQKAQEHWNGRLAPLIRSALVDPEGRAATDGETKP